MTKEVRHINHASWSKGQKARQNLSLGKAKQGSDRKNRRKHERRGRTPRLNEKIDSGKTHLQDLARWWRTSKGVDIPKISQFYWALFEKTRFLCFYIIKSSKKRAKIEPKYP